MNSIVDIGGIKVGDGQPPFIIAELSGNHNQSLDRAIKIVDSIAESGANAVKIQTYTPETMTLNISDGDFLISDPDSPWYGNSLYELYEKAMTPYEWHEPIFERCKHHGLIYLSTPFDDEAVNFLEQFEPPVYKIASFENTDTKLLEKVAKTGKPIIVSTGMSSLSDLQMIVDTVNSYSDAGLIFLKCTSAYPANPSNINLKTIPHMKKMFRIPVGLSDHTLGTGVSVAAVTLGANVVEKHFTISRADGGVDAEFSMEPSEFEQMVIECNRAYQAVGMVNYGITKEEEASAKFKRSLYVVKDIKKGECLTSENLKSIRPGFGASPKMLDIFIGKKVNQDLKSGTPMDIKYLFYTSQ